MVKIWNIAVEVDWKIQPRYTAAGNFLATMSLSRRFALQCCTRRLRLTTDRQRGAVVVWAWGQRRHNSAEAANPKISNIVDQIGQLTLLETADLVSSLKVGSIPKMKTKFSAHAHAITSRRRDLTFPICR
jgi:hypothetical protein